MVDSMHLTEKFELGTENTATLTNSCRRGSEFISKSTTLKTNSESEAAEPEDDVTITIEPTEATLTDVVTVIDGSKSAYVILQPLHEVVE